MKKVIFWDFDGTLVYSEHLWSNCMYDALKRHLPKTNLTVMDVRKLSQNLYSWDRPEEDNTSLVGDMWWRDMEKSFQKLFTALGIPDEIAVHVSQDVREEILKVENYRLYEDAVSTLQECMKRGYRNYILSNNYPELHQIIDKLHLLPYLDGSIVSAVIGYDKPRREIFTYARKISGNPDICYMVGDNPKADIEGGNRDKMITVFVHRRAACQADYTVESLREIPYLLQ